MSKKAVEQWLGRMLVDEQFRKNVEANPLKATAGIDLSPDEREGLSKLDISKFNAEINEVWNGISLAFGRNIN